jgi:hypothetical protein
MSRWRTGLLAVLLGAFLLAGCNDLSVDTPKRKPANPGGLVADPFAVENAGREDRPAPPASTQKP